MTGKQRIREILLGIVATEHPWFDPEKAVDQALDSIEEVVKEVIGQENEYSRDMPVPDPDPFALPSDHQNQLRRYQLGRWESK